METVVLSDLIGVSDPGRAAIRAFANAKPTGLEPAAAEFAAEHRPPKLSYQSNKFRNSNPNPAVTLPPMSTKDPNVKMKEFKERLKLSKFVEGADAVQSTGLFSFSDLTSTEDTKVKRGMKLSNSTSDTGVADKNKSKHKTTIRRFKNTGGVDVDIHHRINKAFQSIESLGKGYAAFSKTLKDATARAVADGKSSRKLLANSTLSRKANDMQKLRTRTTRPAVKIDVTRPINKMFGLDTSKVLHTSGSDDDTDATVSEAEVKNNLKKLSLTGKPSRQRTKRVSMSAAKRSPSPEITVIKDKRFLARHEKQGNLLNKDIADMKSQLEVGDKKMQREARQANIDLKHSHVQRPSNLKRLMAYNPDQGTGRRLIDFLQSTGGVSGGWDSEDHNVFVKIYQQWKSSPLRVTNLVKKEIPDKTGEQIADHIGWYEKYEALNNANKEYVRKWQIAQRREKEEIYRLAREEKMAEVHAEKKKHDLVKGKRDEERERNKVKLDGWKSSLALEKKMLRINVDLIREPENESRIGQLQEAMKNMKKGFSSLQPKHPDVRKFLALKKLANTTGPVNSKAEESSGTASSGIFSDEDGVPQAYNRGMNQNVVVTEAPKQLSNSNVRSKQPTSLLATHTRKSSNKPTRRSYQSRDAQMIETRRKSIQAKLEKKKNKSLLTAHQIKEHLKKNDAPSNLMNPTQGWLQHQEAKNVEKLQATGTEYKGILLKHNISRPTSSMFKPEDNRNGENNEPLI